LTCGIDEIVDCAWVSAELTEDVPVFAVHSACGTFGQLAPHWLVRDRGPADPYGPGQ